MITHTLAGWRDAVSIRLFTNDDDTWGPLFWHTSVLSSSNYMHDLRPILFSRLWVDRGGIRLVFLGTGTYLINAGVLSCSRPSDSGERCEMEIGKNAEKRESFCPARHSVHRTSYPEGLELAT